MPKIDDKKFLLILVFLHLALILPLSYCLNIWMDEASTLHSTQNGLLPALSAAIDDERQSPLYFCILGLWRELSRTIFFARLFSILCGVLSIKFFFDLTRRFFDEKETGFMTAIFALHPILIWASLEIRVYALGILLTILLLEQFSKTYLESADISGNEVRKKELVYVILAVVALYTNYYLGFILVGNFVALLALKRFQKSKTYFWQMLIAGLCILPLLWIVKQQFSTNSVGFQAAPSLVTGGKILLSHALSFIFPTELSPPSEPTIISIFRIWLVRVVIVLLAFVLIKNRFRAVDRRMLIFGTIAGAVFVPFLGIYFLLGADYIALRHVFPLFVPLFLLVAALFVKLIPRRILPIVVLIYAALFSYSLYNQYSPLAKRGDWIRIAKYIETNEKPNQPIIVFQNYDALSLPYHYKGVNKILPDDNFFAWHPEDDFAGENALKKQTDFVISQIPTNAEEIWLATEELCQNEETAASCRPLENYVETNYTVLKTEDFYKERLRLLKKK